MTAKRVLFLDDDPWRHKMVRPHMKFDAAYTAADCIRLLAESDYDVVFLDHDLGGAQMVESEGPEETGYTVAKWMEANRRAVGLVVVHSLNPVGRANMLALLRNAGYQTLECPFFRLVPELPRILAQEPAT